MPWPPVAAERERDTARAELAKVMLGRDARDELARAREAHKLRAALLEERIEQRDNLLSEVERLRENIERSMR